MNLAPSTPVIAAPDRVRRRLLGLALALASSTIASCADASARSAWGQSEAVRALARRLAASTGLPRGWIAQQLARARYSAVTARLVVPTPRGQKNWQAYRARLLKPARIDAGAEFIHANAPLLDRAQTAYGVPPDVITGLLGVETYWGRNMGRVRVLDALTTLALDWPAAAPHNRSRYFAGQLGAFLQWCQAGSIDPTDVRGSYAGAIGMPQFMPGAIRQWGASFDGAAVDLIGRVGDAIASVGNFLAQHGWQRGEPTHFAVTVPATVDPQQLRRLLGPDIVPTFGAAELVHAGLLLDTGAAGYAGKLALVELPNADQPSDYVLGTDNFFALTRYNRSAFYALAVLELGAAALQQAAIDPA